MSDKMMHVSTVDYPEKQKKCHRSITLLLFRIKR